MLFHSYLFLFAFLPITLGGLAVFRHFGWHTGMKHWLLLVSLVFFGWADVTALVILGLSILVNFSVGKFLARTPRKSVLACGILFNLGLLGYYKYATWVGQMIGYDELTIVLPLAISFFTFQQIAFLVDCHRRITQPDTILDYALFISFFPQLIAGPIVHHRAIMPQFADRRNFTPSFENFNIGFTFFIIGLFKKVVISGELQTYVDPVYDAAANGYIPTTSDAWVATLAYSFHIYFDFSAYCDMAIGLARMIGIHLPLNFFSPYKAVSIVDFWRRWHITLSRFLRDYVYIPLGGGRKSAARQYGAIILTMLLGGMWHGAGTNFLIWGALHGVFIVTNHAWRRIRKTKSAGFERILSIILTFAAVTFAWVFFRAADTQTALIILSSMGGYQTPAGMDLVPTGWRDICLVFTPAAIIVFVLPNITQMMRDTLSPTVYKDVANLEYQRNAMVWRPSVFYAIATSLLAVLAILSMTRAEPFIYFRF